MRYFSVPLLYSLAFLFGILVDKIVNGEIAVAFAAAARTLFSVAGVSIYLLSSEHSLD